MTYNLEMGRKRVVFCKYQFSKISDLLALTDELRDAWKPPCLHNNGNHSNVWFLKDVEDVFKQKMRKTVSAQMFAQDLMPNATSPLVFFFPETWLNVGNFMSQGKSS